MARSLFDLQNHVFAACQSLESASAAGEQSDAKRRVTDAVTCRAVRHLHRHRPQSDHDIARMQRRFAICNQQQAEKVCGFAVLSFIALEFLGWLVQQAFDYILRWWRSDHAASESVECMMLSSPELNSDFDAA